MKTHPWIEDQTPDFKKTSDGGLFFFNHPDFCNYEVGDQIEYKTRLGVMTFEVIDIWPEEVKTFEDRQVVTAKRL